MDDREKLIRLSKYEARDAILFRDDAPVPMEFHSTFGPLIAKTCVPSHLIDHVNDHVSAQLPTDVGSELLLSEEFCRSGGDDSLQLWLMGQLRRYVKQVERNDQAGIEIDQCWVVNQYADTASPMHFHSGDLSGVMYLTVPEIAPGQEQKNYISGRKAGYINFLIGGKQRFSRSLVSFQPVVADFFVFPAWLLHGAEPFQGTGVRRSLAFNARVID
ncbi:MAG: putative 2OG-Fe(II) oxygenase [Fuerstiella sp.]